VVTSSVFPYDSGRSNVRNYGEFSYSEAPVSMKSLMQAIWILTAAFGNILVIAIVKMNPVSPFFILLKF
jgi:dipeptide/tripeptide permease